MDHLFHIFGGGCGEHMVWPWLASAGVGLVTARNYLKAQWHRLRLRFETPNKDQNTTPDANL